MKKRSDGYYQKKIVINGKTRFIYAKSVKELDQKIMKATQEPQKENMILSISLDTIYAKNFSEFLLITPKYPQSVSGVDIWAGSEK